jgi:hypothetical protein
VGGVSEAGPSSSFDHPNTAPQTVLLYHATFQEHVDDITAGIKLDRAQRERISVAKSMPFT